MSTDRQGIRCGGLRQIIPKYLRQIMSKTTLRILEVELAIQSVRRSDSAPGEYSHSATRAFAIARVSEVTTGASKSELYTLTRLLNRYRSTDFASPAPWVRSAVVPLALRALGWGLGALEHCTSASGQPILPVPSRSLLRRKDPCTCQRLRPCSLGSQCIPATRAPASSG